MRARPATSATRSPRPAAKWPNALGWGKQHGTMRKTKRRGTDSHRCRLHAQSHRLQSRAHPQAHRRLRQKSARKPENRLRQTENPTTKDGNGPSLPQVFQQIARSLEYSAHCKHPVGSARIESKPPSTDRRRGSIWPDGRSEVSNKSCSIWPCDAGGGIGATRRAMEGITKNDLPSGVCSTYFTPNVCTGAS